MQRLTFTWPAARPYGDTSQAMESVFADSSAARERPRWSLLSGIPVATLVVAALAGLLHLAPYWHAQLQTPPGWTFTGNVRSSPDYMQYRVWARQADHTGILVTNKFTTEPNSAHIPVLVYVTIGEIARAVGSTPEVVYSYVGALLAALLTVGLFLTVRQFIPRPYQTWWVFLAVMFGGGLGAHFKVLGYLGTMTHNLVLERLFSDPIRTSLLFEDYRSHYVFITLFDTHYSLVWLGSLAAVLAYYFTLRDFSLGRLTLTAALYAVMTLLHIYEGITLLAITVAVMLLCWRRGLEVRPALLTLAGTGVSVALAFGWVYGLYHSSGLPMPSWREIPIQFSILLAGYALAWTLIAWGVSDLWQEAALNECFLLGWALGCTAVTLAGPFYPYPSRGTMTLQVALFILAGVIYFARYRRVGIRAALAAMLILGATPVFELVARQWANTRFTEDASYAWLSPAHLEIVDSLRQRASAEDALLADEADVLWLAPEYPGTHYAGHFFLTVDFPRKRNEVSRFFESSPEQQAAFMDDQRIRFLYIDAKQQPDRFERVPGLVLIKSEPIGSLFENVLVRGDARG